MHVCVCVFLSCLLTLLDSTFFTTTWLAHVSEWAWSTYRLRREMDPGTVGV